MDPATRQVYYSKDSEKAMHFGLKIITEEDLKNGNFSGSSGNDPATGTDFTVTNTPKPIEPDPVASLEVSKTVTGKGGDQKKEFTFTVTLGKWVTGEYGDMTFTNGVATFHLKHGEKKTAVNLPAGTTYKVVETDNSGYTVTVNG